MLHISNITKSFGGVHALKDVSFSIGDREIVGVIGPNGSGKSTLINVVSGFYRPDGGDVTLDDVSLVVMAPAAIRRHGIGRTFQNLRLVEKMSVLDNTIAGYYLAQTGTRSLLWTWLSELLFLPSALKRKQEAERVAREALVRVGLSEKSDMFAAKLSYADQKRLELARVLTLPPRILILDEPTAGMSVEEADELIRTIVDLVKTSDDSMSLLLIEHRLDLVLDVSDRAVVMDGGAVINDDVPAVIAHDPEVRRIYVGGE